MQLELSTQLLSPDQIAEIPSAASRPLYELADTVIDDGSGQNFYATKAPWPVNIDEFARAYVESALRTETVDYQQASNRVAIVVGEGAFNTSVLYTPEDTVLLIDISRGACRYMQSYSIALQEEPSSALWKRRMQTVWDTTTYRIPESIDEAFANQIRQWNDSGYHHSFSDEATYYRAHKAAQTKALIPIQMDITNIDHINTLATRLNKLDAKITFANFTNLIDIAFRCRADNFAEAVSALPFSEFAPILASYVQIPTPIEANSGANTRSVSGPFFGLSNLVRTYVNG